MEHPPAPPVQEMLEADLPVKRPPGCTAFFCTHSPCIFNPMVTTEVDGQAVSLPNPKFARMGFANPTQGCAHTVLAHKASGGAEAIRQYYYSVTTLEHQRNEMPIWDMAGENGKWMQECSITTHGLLVDTRNAAYGGLFMCEMCFWEAGIVKIMPTSYSMHLHGTNHSRHTSATTLAEMRERLQLLKVLDADIRKKAILLPEDRKEQLLLWRKAGGPMDLPIEGKIVARKDKALAALNAQPNATSTSSKKSMVGGKATARKTSEIGLSGVTAAGGGGGGDGGSAAAAAGLLLLSCHSCRAAQIDEAGDVYVEDNRGNGGGRMNHVEQQQQEQQQSLWGQQLLYQQQQQDMGWQVEDQKDERLVQQARQRQQQQQTQHQQAQQQQQQGRGVASASVPTNVAGTAAAAGAVWQGCGTQNPQGASLNPGSSIRDEMSKQALLVSDRMQSVMRDLDQATEQQLLSDSARSDIRKEVLLALYECHSPDAAARLERCLRLLNRSRKSGALGEGLKHEEARRVVDELKEITKGLQDPLRMASSAARVCEEVLLRLEGTSHLVEEASSSIHAMAAGIEDAVVQRQCRATEPLRNAMAHINELAREFGINISNAPEVPAIQGPSSQPQLPSKEALEDAVKVVEDIVTRLDTEVKPCVKALSSGLQWFIQRQPDLLRASSTYTSLWQQQQQEALGPPGAPPPGLLVPGVVSFLELNQTKAELEQLRQQHEKALAEKAELEATLAEMKAGEEAGEEEEEGEEEEDEEEEEEQEGEEGEKEVLEGSWMHPSKRGLADNAAAAAEPGAKRQNCGTEEGTGQAKQTSTSTARYRPRKVGLSEGRLRYAALEPSGTGASQKQFTERSAQDAALGSDAGTTAS